MKKTIIGLAVGSALMGGTAMAGETGRTVGEVSGAVAAVAAYGGWTAATGTAVATGGALAVVPWAVPLVIAGYVIGGEVGDWVTDQAWKPAS